MPPHLTVRQLDAFIAVAELSNFTLAARRMRLTPSAISSLVGELEAAVGFAVFQRTTRKVSLTSDGREFLPSAVAVQRQMRMAAIAAANVRNRSVDVVQVAAPLSAAAVLLPPVLAAFKALNPRIVVRILDTGVEWLADRVATGDADLAVGPDQPVSSDVTCRILFESPWVIWCAPDHPLAREPRPTWEDLGHFEYFAAGRDHEHSVAPLLAAHETPRVLAPAHVVDNITTALGLASAGLGVTFSPAYVEPLARSFGLVMRRVGDPEIARNMALFTAARRTPSSAVQAAREFLERDLSQICAKPAETAEAH